MSETKSRQMSGKKGTSLIELLVAVFITAITLLALYSALIYGMKINLRTRNKNIASYITSQEMEILRTTSFSDLINQSDGPFIGTVEDLDKLPSAEGKLTIEDYEGSADIKKVTVKVVWQEGGDPKEVKLVSLIAKGGINP